MGGGLHCMCTYVHKYMCMMIDTIGFTLIKSLMGVSCSCRESSPVEANYKKESSQRLVYLLDCKCTHVIQSGTTKTVAILMPMIHYWLKTITYIIYRTVRVSTHSGVSPLVFAEHSCTG